MCAVLAVAKFMLGRVLTSRALITDGRKNIDSQHKLTHARTLKHAHARTYFMVSPLSFAVQIIVFFLSLPIVICKKKIITINLSDHINMPRVFNSNENSFTTRTVNDAP